MKNIKNIRVIKETLHKVKGKVLALVTAGTMLLSGQHVSAEEKKVTSQDVVKAMITGDRISAEMTKEKAKQLEIQAEEAVRNAGASLLPYPIMERYNNLANLSGDQRREQLLVLAGLCDAVLFDGSGNMMSYPEAIQLNTVCNKVCDELISMGETKVYSVIQSQKLGEDVQTSIPVIAKMAKENMNLKKDTYIIALETDLGFYDHCFLGEQDQNMPTGEKENNTAKNALLVSSVLASSGILLSALEGRKKEEKGKAYQKRR